VGDRELVTSRLRLRRPVEGDVPVVLSIHAEPAAVAHNPSEMLVDAVGAQQLWARWSRHWDVHGFGYWAVTLLPDGRVIGFCGLKVMRLGDDEVLNLFYRFHPDVWGRGFATESATAVTAWARAARPHDEVIARVRPDNVASHKVAASAGLVRAAALDATGEDGLDLMYRLPD
jgi:RimJ/RimL family protein N-acetyltransferase